LRTGDASATKRSLVTRCVIWLMTATILTGLTGTASAAPLSASEETVSAMMANVEEDLTFLYDRAGVVQAPLVFSSSLDPASMAYSYSTLTGSSYNGTPASLVASGNFDAASSQWHSNSIMSLGGNSWAVTGSTAFTSGPAYVTEMGDAFSRWQPIEQ
jgi:hypothetical protein